MHIESSAESGPMPDIPDLESGHNLQQTLEAGMQNVGGEIDRLRLVARLAPPLPPEGRTEIFQRIAGNDESPPDQEAVEIVVKSYLGFVLGAALAVYKSEADARLEPDDLVGSAMEELVRCVRRFAQGGDYRSFSAYLRSALNSAIRTEIAYQRYGISREVGWERTRLMDYLRTKRLLEEEAPGTMGWRDVATATGMTSERAAALYAIAARVTRVEEPDRHQLYAPSPEHGEHSPKKILVERALLLLNENHADTLDKYFGITGLQYTIDDLAKKRGVNHQVIRTEIYRAKQLFREIITEIQEGKFDLIAWRESHQGCRNVLTFLAISGILIPPNATLAELRAIAMQHLPMVSPKQETQQLLVELYGLKDGVPKKGKDLAEATGISMDTIYRRDRQFMSEHGVTTAKRQIDPTIHATT